MDITSGLGLVALIVLVLGNGFFVATEFAIVAVRRSRLEALAAAGNTRAQSARDMVDHLDAYIAACQLGITIMSLALGWLGEPALARLVEPPLEVLVGQFASTAAPGVAIGVSFAIITALHIVLGELAPKGLALQRAEATTLFVARPMHLFYVLFRAPVNVLNAIGNGLLRLAGLEPATGHEMVHSVEELRLLVTGMQRAGVVEESEARIAGHAFQFADLTAGALMSPRTELEGIPAGTPFDELVTRAAAMRHSRLLVYRDTLDDILGVVRIRDIFRALALPSRPETVDALVRSVLVVPETKAADDLLDEMRHARQSLALVVDEYGGTAGLVTIEDLVEALVGPILEESEPHSGDAQAEPTYGLQPDGSVLFDGLTRLDEFEELSGVRLPEAAHREVDTLGGLIMLHLGRVAHPGDRIELDRRALLVEELDGRRVSLVRLVTSGGETAETPEAANVSDAPA